MARQIRFKRLPAANLRAVIGHYTVKLVLCSQLVALVQIHMKFKSNIPSGNADFTAIWLQLPWNYLTIKGHLAEPADRHRHLQHVRILWNFPAVDADVPLGCWYAGGNFQIDSQWCQGALMVLLNGRIPSSHFRQSLDAAFLSHYNRGRKKVPTWNIDIVNISWQIKLKEYPYHAATVWAT